MSTLQTQFKDTTLEFLKSPDAVIAYIESLERSMNTKKLYYITIVSKLKDINLPEFSQAFKAYKAKQDEYNSKAQANMEKQAMDRRESDIWIHWPDVIALRQRLWPRVDSLHSYQDYVILCLYTYLPPMRADYAPMHVVHDPSQVGPGENALVVEPDGLTFVFQEYKTASRYGRKEVQVPRKLERILRDWVELVPSEVLLMNADGSPMDPRQLSAAVIRIFQKHTGKAAGINILRHSFITHLRRGERSFREQKKIADLMGHSVGMNVLYNKIE